jgi:hypothetical protein
LEKAKRLLILFPLRHGHSQTWKRRCREEKVPGYFFAKQATLSGPVSTRPRSVSALERIPVIFLADFIMLCDPQTVEK